MQNPSAPIKLLYAPRRRRAVCDRLASLFTVAAVVAVLGSGSVAWALLMRHH